MSSIALLPDLLRQALVGDVLRAEQLGMHADDEHFLVVRAIEDADVTPAREHARGAPQKIVIELLRRRRLERVHLAALRD